MRTDHPFGIAAHTGDLGAQCDRDRHFSHHARHQWALERPPLLTGAES
jgi:hypothetical protein